MSKKKSLEISQIIQQFLPDVEAQGGLSGHQRSILKLMRLCKTSALGGHKERCESCHHTRIHYNSCGNRNCPSCQGVNKERWIMDRQQDLLPVHYFHCVFTIPSELYALFKYNKRLLYDLMLKCVKDTLLVLGQDAKYGIQGKIGGINVLHTWTQQMTYHPHVHVIVPAGGLTHNNTWQYAKSQGRFLFPVRVMSRLFRGKLLAGIHALYRSGKLDLSPQMRKQYCSIKDNLYKKEWVVYAKKAFGGPDQVLEYLGRYTHKICISNYRILRVTQSHVTFRYLDRKANKTPIKTISGEKFLRLFAAHILPKGFVKIRHFGFLSSRTKKSDLAKVRKSLGTSTVQPQAQMTIRQLIFEATGQDPYLCPNCQKAEMTIIAIMPPIRGSPEKIPFRCLPANRKIMLQNCQVK